MDQQAVQDLLDKYGPELVEIAEFQPPITLQNAQNRELSPFR